MAKVIPVTIEIIEFLSYFQFGKHGSCSQEISRKMSSKDHILISYDYECYFENDVPSKVFIKIAGIKEEFDVINLNEQDYFCFRLGPMDNFRLKHKENNKSIKDFLSGYKLRSDLLDNRDKTFDEQLKKVLSCKFNFVNYISSVGEENSYVYSFKKLPNGNFLVNITNNDVELVPEISGEFVSFKRKD